MPSTPEPPAEAVEAGIRAISGHASCRKAVPAILQAAIATGTLLPKPQTEAEVAGLVERVTEVLDGGPPVDEQDRQDMRVRHGERAIEILRSLFGALPGDSDA